MNKCIDGRQAHTMFEASPCEEANHQDPLKYAKNDSNITTIGSAVLYMGNCESGSILCESDIIYQHLERTTKRANKRPHYGSYPCVFSSSFFSRSFVRWLVLLLVPNGLLKALFLFTYGTIRFELASIVARAYPAISSPSLTLYLSSSLSLFLLDLAYSCVKTYNSSNLIDRSIDRFE